MLSVYSIFSLSFLTQINLTLLSLITSENKPCSGSFSLSLRNLIYTLFKFFLLQFLSFGGMYLICLLLLISLPRLSLLLPGLAFHLTSLYSTHFTPSAPVFSMSLFPFNFNFPVILAFLLYFLFMLFLPSPSTIR